MDSSPDDIEMLKAELALARARAADDAATIARQNLEIAKLRRQLYGPRSERTFRLLDQMELELEDLEVAATEDEIAAERAAAKTTTVAAFTRKRPARQPFPAHLPRERGMRAAVMYSLIVTAKMNDIDPQAWLADVLARIAGHPAHRLDELLPWNWHPATPAVSRAA